MALYTRPQLSLLLALLAAAGVGLAVGRWRATHLDAVERLETLDREVTKPPPGGPTHEAVRPSGAQTDTPTRAPVDHQPRRRVAPSGARDAAPAPSPPLDLNRASEADLLQLPGVGRVLAARIVAAREAAGRFGAVDDLRRVPGLGRSRLESLRGFLTASP
jgi:competence ComEA-like helix-hairpin-helix protein